MIILICSIVSPAAAQSRLRAPVIPGWTQPEAWQKIEKSMTEAQVTAILGTPLLTKEGTLGTTWFYQEGEESKGAVRFKSGKVAIWKEPDWQLLKEVEQARLKAAEEAAALEAAAIEAEKLAAEKAMQAEMEKKRLKAELKRTQIEKVHLTRKLQAEQREKLRRERAAEKRAAMENEPEKAKSLFDKLAASSLRTKVVIYSGGGLGLLILIYIFYCRRN